MRHPQDFRPASIREAQFMRVADRYPMGFEPVSPWRKIGGAVVAVAILLSLLGLMVAL